MSIRSMQVVVPQDVLMRDVEDEAVLINLKTELCFNLDAIGARVWNVITNSSNINDAIEQLQSEYAGEPNQLEQDTINLVQQLEEVGLISLISSA